MLKYVTLLRILIHTEEKPMTSQFIQEKNLISIILQL